MKTFILFFIKLYRLFLSPAQVLLADLFVGCRFYPSCSVYSADAIAKYGARKGMWRIVTRLARCNPLHKGGYDPA